MKAVDIKNGVLCRLWKPKNKLGKADVQIVLPEMYRCDILKIAHDVAMAGHMGVERTLQRIRKRFLWPGVVKDVKNYVQSCPECQKGAKRPMKVLLMKMPIIGKPFERIAMDIVGPLPKTSNGYQYILVISDYATRFPEAYPLRRLQP